MLPAMILVMLYRVDDYAEPHPATAIAKILRRRRSPAQVMIGRADSDSSIVGQASATRPRTRDAADEGRRAAQPRPPQTRSVDRAGADAIAGGWLRRSPQGGGSVLEVTR